LCNVSVIEFFIQSIQPAEFENAKVLEVGSKYVNGSVRPLITRFCNPKQYIGVDTESGKYVDVVLSAESLVAYFGEECFDVIISTELLEHVKDWRLVIGNMKKVLKKDGLFYASTRSLGFPYHGYPHDYWRFELDDIESIFSDFRVRLLLKDPSEPGVFVKASKPVSWTPVDLSNISLHSMILGRRTKDYPDERASTELLPLNTLRTIFEQRADLQKAFPEARYQDFKRLIRWAASVSSCEWMDASYSLLQPYANWYLKQSDTTASLGGSTESERAHEL
jgi:SAM-dependent methyltransferase